MWEPYTERARNVIVQAQKAAQELGNNYIGTEHLLLALSELPNLKLPITYSLVDDVLTRNPPPAMSVASQVLQKYNLDAYKIKSEIKSVVGCDGKVFNDKMGFTPRGKAVLAQALAISRIQRVTWVGTEHLLLALFDEKEGVAARVLINLVGLDNVNKMTFEILAIINKMKAVS